MAAGYGSSLSSFAPIHDRKPPSDRLDSYGRLFPKQDTLPKDGFGNLIAAPLQRKPRNEGKSVFVNTHLEPAPDQWTFLQGVKRLRLSDLKTLVAGAQ